MAAAMCMEVTTKEPPSPPPPPPPSASPRSSQVPGLLFSFSDLLSVTGVADQINSRQSTTIPGRGVTPALTQSPTPPYRRRQSAFSPSIGIAASKTPASSVMPTPERRELVNLRLRRPQRRNWCRLVKSLHRKPYAGLSLSSKVSDITSPSLPASKTSIFFFSDRSPATPPPNSLPPPPPAHHHTASPHPPMHVIQDRTTTTHHHRTSTYQCTTTRRRPPPPPPPPPPHLHRPMHRHQRPEPPPPLLHRPSLAARQLHRQSRHQNSIIQICSGANKTSPAPAKSAAAPTTTTSPAPSSGDSTALTPSSNTAASPTSEANISDHHRHCRWAHFEASSPGPATDTPAPLVGRQA
ncbi:formin-like protein 20 [Dioscorea cayenensis subsp. rotundata]|uniref:Formin-like protein 20 n=1 Tax=Dioscorea cayennensis subsp. rotundata TaxID=55577 RepID=A0AB40AL98_DIOCR|nr:formin-like protein 20 [Dioscorea cayenensis subsp. rotundata]